ncbi:MAG: AAA family ATPase [Nitrospirae bacterium]|uniref:AAA family ATPase n=1 Tax=Candidatus Magnetobacterium casense TaxID=1455061 RepID=UPI0006971AA0|nr:ATP-binding protein [Candidatus Magnetobacterium casensis]MBF0337341.1 AAA family ATPase [Nitrospirota bacterium]
MADENVYITKVNIRKVRHLMDINISLSGISRQHLIFTGINGSGKTSVLEAIRDYLGNADQDKYINSIAGKEFLDHNKRTFLNKRTHRKIETSILLEKIIKKTGIELYFNHSYLFYRASYIRGEHFFAFFNARRKAELKQPTGIRKIEIKQQYVFNDKASSEFIQHIVNLQVDRLFAERGNDTDTVKNINNWFEIFEQRLKEIFEDNEIKLEFDIKNYDYHIVKRDREKFTFNQLSDGYSAIFDIMSEIIMRMEPHRTKSYDIQGIVLIDEIETHLHVSLQKKILPLLTSFFPNVQFIVTTHSPFVLNSIENAVICDLENNIIASDFSGYSYSSIVEDYFDSDKYSQVVKDKIERYERLAGLEMLTEEEEDKLFKLEMYLKEIPAFLAPELKLKFQQVQLVLLLKNIKNGKR